MLVALLYAPILNTDLCREGREGWANFNMVGGKEVELKGWHDLFFWVAEVENLFVMDAINA